MRSMPSVITHRRHRGLSLHHRRHPSAHPRRLVNRTARWGEPPVRGVCRWCHEDTADIRLTWHEYCLDDYRVASGQKPERMQLTMCETCGDAAAELDHRLAIEVARTMSPDALMRAFTLENLQWLCQECHRRKTRADRRLARYLSGCSLDWRRARRVARRNRFWLAAFLEPFGMAGARAIAAQTGRGRTVEHRLAGADVTPQRG